VPQIGGNVKALDFMNTFGVNVHFNENNYRNTSAIADALNIIGFSRIRSRCVRAEEAAAWKDVAAKSKCYFPNGLNADVLITGYLNDTSDVSLASQKKLVPQIADFIEMIEGPNEINNYSVGEGTHGPSDKHDRTKEFASNSVAWAEALYQWRQAEPLLSRVKLLAPSIASGMPEDYSSLPDISQYVDAGNLHFYAGNGRQPSKFEGGNFEAIYRWYKAAATPAKPVALTEWGQTTAGKKAQDGCNEATQAKYILNQMFDAVAMGVYRAYIYQLMDDTSDGDPTGKGGSEEHFGIFDYKWRVKPAAQALANVKNLLADKTANFMAVIPDYNVKGVKDAGAAGSSLSISMSGGSTFIVVWNEPRIWDSKANKPETPPVNKVTVNFGGNYAYKVHDPLIGLDAIAAGQGSSVEVNLSGSPIMIQIVPAGK